VSAVFHVALIVLFLWRAITRGNECRYRGMPPLRDGEVWLWLSLAGFFLFVGLWHGFGHGFGGDSTPSLI